MASECEEPGALQVSRFGKDTLFELVLPEIASQGAACRVRMARVARWRDAGDTEQGLAQRYRTPSIRPGRARPRATSLGRGDSASISADIAAPAARVGMQLATTAAVLAARKAVELLAAAHRHSERLVAGAKATNARIDDPRVAGRAPDHDPGAGARETLASWRISLRA